VLRQRKNCCAEMELATRFQSLHRLKVRWWSWGIQDWMINFP